METRVFEDSTGTAIHYRFWPAKASSARQHPRGTIALLHGVGEHSGRYIQTAEDFAAAGWNVWADDHRGHGETGRAQHGGDLAKIGQLGPGGLRQTIESVQEFLELAQASMPDRPFVVIAHSWGSLIAQILFNRNPDLCDALVLTGTAYRTPLYMDGGDLNRKHRHLGTTGLEWLSRDPAVAQAFVADPLCTSTPLRKLFGLRDTLRLLGKPARRLADIPLLLVVGSDDTLGGERSAKALADAYIRRAGMSDVTVFVYRDARHEVFNETNRTEVVSDVRDWLEHRFPVQR